VPAGSHQFGVLPLPAGNLVGGEGGTPPEPFTVSWWHAAALADGPERVVHPAATWHTRTRCVLQKL